ncbi:nucleotide triphosphate diphosphatase NUDT15 [Pseudonocardia endophytica]|uniref:ADP-ribose pyrophosphatase YjhB (NUDIX family) n=1 Tax=Pseudonocardia endophytica TaxID=401976 RepID=A0A4R1HWI7_PSEEN|nr:NUDIX domain-containing protein [Pseudonocardia endophytica]TCK21902.1 ADP-ribose pyrophosphatase YjhB (NUDIX family) [Pseudonocardia endophytica]
MVTPVLGVGVLVRDDGGRVLLGHRVKPGEAPVWSFPGGAVEAGESFEAAAVRELREETGLDARGVDVAGVILSPGPAPWLTAVTVARDVRGEPALTEPDVFAEWRWCPRDEVPDALFAPTRMAFDLLEGRPVADAVAAYRLAP